jgi:GNAT superfamily N-acetyltransferase
MAISGLTYRDTFSAPADRAAVHRLLFDVFGVNVSPIHELGLADPTYRAFSYLDDVGSCVANAATFTLSLVINGRSVEAMGVQSVATRPEWRRRGLSHDLLERALRWCDANARLTFLFTAIPGFYAPLGFRIVPQFAYVGNAPGASLRASDCRRLNLDASADRNLLVRVLQSRVPVSARFAVRGSGGAFMLNMLDQARLSAWYIAKRHAVVVTATPSGGTSCLVDVAAPEMITLEEAMAVFGAQPQRVAIHFPTDLLAWRGTATPVQTSTVLMVRGDLEQVEPFMIPATMAF